MQRGDNISAIARGEDDGERFVASGSACEDLQARATMFAASTKRQIFMHNRDALSLAEPRKIIQALFERIPVPAEVTRKPQPLRQNAKQLLFAADTLGNAHDECSIALKSGWVINKLKGQGRGV
jgi:hypothetical protein